MRKNYDFTLSEGFVLNKQTGKLEEYKPIGISFDTEREIVIYRGLFWDGERTILENDFDLYESVSAYEQGNCIVPNRNFDIRQVFKDVCQVQIVNEEILAWTFANGKPEPINLRGRVVHYSVKNGFLRYKGIDKELNVYDSKEDVINIYDIVIIDKDGNERIREGLSTKLKLNEKQMEAVKTLEEAWKALKDLNVGVMFNTENYDLLCCNKPSNVETVWCYEEGFTEVEGLLTRIDASLYDTFNCEGYWMRHQS